jgi:hypothetical protein
MIGAKKMRIEFQAGKDAFRAWALNLHQKKISESVSRASRGKPWFERNGRNVPKKAVVKKSSTRQTRWAFTCHLTICRGPNRGDETPKVVR